LIVDTSVVIAAIERHDPDAMKAIEQMAHLSTRSMVVLGELNFGVQAAPAVAAAVRTRTRDLYLAISDPSSVASLDGGLLAQWFGLTSAIAQTDRISIGQNDRWIVAEAMAHSTGLWTADAAMRDLVEAVRKRHDVADAVFIGS
jgi:predicted nucleic acid-binding protein